MYMYNYAHVFTRRIWRGERLEIVEIIVLINSSTGRRRSSSSSDVRRWSLRDTCWGTCCVVLSEVGNWWVSVLCKNAQISAHHSILREQTNICEVKVRLNRFTRFVETCVAAIRARIWKSSCLWSFPGVFLLHSVHSWPSTERSSPDRSRIGRSTLVSMSSFLQEIKLHCALWFGTRWANNEPAARLEHHRIHFRHSERRALLEPPALHRSSLSGATGISSSDKMGWMRRRGAGHRI